MDDCSNYEIPPTPQQVFEICGATWGFYKKYKDMAGTEKFNDAVLQSNLRTECQEIANKYPFSFCRITLAEYTAILDGYYREFVQKGEDING